MVDAVTVSHFLARADVALGYKHHLQVLRGTNGVVFVWLNLRQAHPGSLVDPDGVRTAGVVEEEGGGIDTGTNV